MIACDGMVVAGLQQPMGTNAVDNSFTFIHVLLFFHSHSLYFDRGSMCVTNTSSLTSTNAGMSLKYDFI